LLVCIATLHSIRTIEYGESFVFVTPPSTSATTTKDGAIHNTMHTTKGRASSIPSSTTCLGARRKDEPWSLSSGSTEQQRQHKNADSAQARRKPFPSTADISYQLLDHGLLTRDEEYELGMKIRKFIDTKKQIDEMISLKKTEQKQRKIENERRREKEAEERRKRREHASGKAVNNKYKEPKHHDKVDDLSMEEELEELLMTKGLNTKYGRQSKSRPGFRDSIEDLYGSFENEEDEEAMAAELGMAIYGIDTYNDDESNSDDLAIVHSYDYGYDGENDGFSAVPETPDSSQLGDTLDDIRMLTEREIEEELGVEGGRKELAQILIQGALAKQQMIKSNVRLVTHIARKWMGSSKGSGNTERNTDNDKKLSKSVALGDWSTPSMDEVIQQGIVGLAIAAERFEPERKFKFSTYATYYITNEVRIIFQAATTQCLYVPPYFYTIKNKYQKIVQDHYRSDPNIVLSMDEIAVKLQLKRERLQFILKSTQTLIQLDAPLGGGITSPGKAGGNDSSQSNDPIVNSLATDEPSPEAVVEQSLLRQCLENALAAELLPLERDIVRLRHGLDDGRSRTIKEVMESCGGMLSIGDIRTVESRAYKKLRFKHSVHNTRLREFAAEYVGVSPELLETAH